MKTGLKLEPRINNDKKLLITRARGDVDTLRDMIIVAMLHLLGLSFYV